MGFYGIGGFYPGWGWGGYGGYGWGLGYGFGPGYYGGYGPYGGYGYGGPYYSPYYRYSPVITVPVTPPVYIQRQEAVAPRPQKPANYWYYCRNPDGYYPYVKKCPDGWLRVAPQPPDQ